jgi:hypothetical protein
MDEGAALSSVPLQNVCRTPCRDLVGARLCRCAEAHGLGSEGETTPLPEAHRHLLYLRRRELQCACRACALLFDGEAGGRGHSRLVPERRIRLDIDTAPRRSVSRWD